MYSGSVKNLISEQKTQEAIDSIRKMSYAEICGRTLGTTEDKSVLALS